MASLNLLYAHRCLQLGYPNEYKMLGSVDDCDVRIARMHDQVLAQTQRPRNGFLIFPM
jgi:hypothetical protein